MQVLERYRREMADARARIAALDWRSIDTRFGRVEYLDTGSGPPVLVVHGITQGADGAHELTDAIVPDGYRLIVPSRFGYLGSSMPEGATPQMQADAFAALLEEISVVGAVVVAGSAGSTSALHLAIRHPDRVRALLLVSANVPGPHQRKSLPPKPIFHALFSSDPVLWVIVTYLPGVMASLSQVLRAPAGAELSATDRAQLARAMRRVFPGKLRATGEVFDAHVSNPAIERIDLSRVHVPTLVMHARDDSGPPYASAVAMAGRIPNARLVTVETGGHLMLGEHAAQTEEARAFIRQHSTVHEVV